MAEEIGEKVGMDHGSRITFSKLERMLKSIQSTMVSGGETVGGTPCTVHDAYIIRWFRD